jgi:patatin-like phospholipase/acyl hydrolase
MAKIKVLSIDGGGIRGIIPAIILAEIERRCNKPICNLFDLIAGTSTGGILALALTAPDPTSPEKPRYSSADLIDFYIENGPHIFATSLCHQLPLVHTLADAVEPRFAPNALERALREKLGDTKLSDALREVLIPAYDLRGVNLVKTGRRLEVELDAGGTPVFFARWKALADPKNFDYYARDVARATSAAPTYFRPFRIRPVSGGEWMETIDGGVFANNPAMCGYTEALKLFNPENEFAVVSIGTGELREPVDLSAAQRWGELGWIRPLLTIMMDGVSKTVDHQLSTVLPYAERPADADRYFRLQPPLGKAHAEMADASPENMELLQEVANQYLSRNDVRRKLKLMSDLLADDPPPHKKAAAARS